MVQVEEHQAAERVDCAEPAVPDPLNPAYQAARAEVAYLAADELLLQGPAYNLSGGAAHNQVVSLGVHAGYQVLAGQSADNREVEHIEQDDFLPAGDYDMLVAQAEVQRITLRRSYYSLILDIVGKAASWRRLAGGFFNWRWCLPLRERVHFVVTELGQMEYQAAV